MSLAPGNLVGPSLRLVRLLAEGGMGSVWIADHIGLKTQVAVKFIAESVAQDPTIMMRFEREATAAAQLRSPHVVQIFDHGMIEGGIPYIVMELLEGESLGRRLDRVGTLNVRETAAIVSQSCRALTKAHGGGVVHRDIKPDNIFLTDSDGELFVKVLDFGIAKQKSDQPIGVTSTGMAVGTPLYMSPEQSVSAKDVTLATDLWAIGAVAYRCLTGRVPFEGETFGALCVMINRGVFPLPSTLRQGIPPAIDAWFTRALATAPAQRFASARELADQFLAAGGFPAGVQVSVPSALPSRSGSPHPAAPSVDVAPAPERTPLSAQTVTVHPSDVRGAVAPGAPRDTAAVQTGPSFAGTALGERSFENAKPRTSMAVKFAAIAALSAIGIAGALTLGRNVTQESSQATSATGSGEAAHAAALRDPAAVAEDKVPVADLGSPGGATLPKAVPAPPSEPEPASPAGSDGKASAPPVASAVEAPKPFVDNHRKQGPSPSVQGISPTSGKTPGKGRSRPPVADPGRDLMEP